MQNNEEIQKLAYEVEELRKENNDLLLDKFKLEEVIIKLLINIF